MSLRHQIVTLCTSRPASWLLRPCWRGAGAIFVLHRFACPDAGVEGTDPAYLRRQLAYLRREGFSLLSLDDVCDGLNGVMPLPLRSVAYTIDDGYRDFHDVAAPIFAEFECPVTVFLTTGFLDRACWMWWDRVEAALLATARSGVFLELAGSTRDYAWSDPQSRRHVAAEIVERLKRVPHETKEEGIIRLLEQLDVDLAPSPPEAYAPMTWEQVRGLESSGVRFGAHTVTHPILSRATGQHMEQEIRGSVSRLDQEVRSPSGVFCYPNGDPDSFGPRESAVLQACDIRYAVSTTFAYARIPARTPARAVLPAHRVSRFVLSERWMEFRQIATGFERVKQFLRSAL